MTLTRRHETKEGWRAAVYSDCEQYRYALTVHWAVGKRLLYVMLNPSKATELANDPTIERCERRARRLGFGSIAVVNLFAWRETSPSLLKQATDPEGPENLAQITAAMGTSDDILAAWGVHGAHKGQGELIAERLRASGKPRYHLGLSKAGHPRHPLYISYSAPLQRWE